MRAEGGPADEGPDGESSTCCGSYCTLPTLESSPADGEEPHQSPCPPTLSLGMMRSSEPCFKNTFPAQRRHDAALGITV